MSFLFTAERQNGRNMGIKKGSRMRILVTGGAGYIGSVCVAELLNQGHEVTVFDSLENGHREAIDHRAELCVGELCGRFDIFNICHEKRPQAVVHFAAYALVGDSIREPLKYFHNNVSGGINLLRAMAMVQCDRIVFSSSCATYGTPSTHSISETCRQSPINPYGETKFMFEKMLDWQPNIRATCLRYFNAAGAWKGLGEDHEPETHLIPNVIKAALGKTECVEIYGTSYDTPDGTCIRDYIHVQDLALAHAMAIEKDITGKFNLGTGTGYSVKEVIRAVQKHTLSKIPIREMPAREGDPAILVANADLAKNVLGWTPQYSSLKKIVKDAWKWHSAHPNGYSFS